MNFIMGARRSHSLLERMVCHGFLIDEVLHHFSPPYLCIVSGILLSRWKLWTSLTSLKKILLGCGRRGKSDGIVLTLTFVGFVVLI